MIGLWSVNICVSVSVSMYINVTVVILAKSVFKKGLIWFKYCRNFFTKDLSYIIILPFGELVIKSRNSVKQSESSREEWKQCICFLKKWSVKFPSLSHQVWFWPPAEFVLIWLNQNQVLLFPNCCEVQIFKMCQKSKNLILVGNNSLKSE